MRNSKMMDQQQSHKIKIFKLKQTKTIKKAIKMNNILVKKINPTFIIIMEIGLLRKIFQMSLILNTVFRIIST